MNKKFAAVLMVLVLTFTFASSALARNDNNGGGGGAGGTFYTETGLTPRAQGGGGAAPRVSVGTTVVAVAKVVRDVVGTATAVETVYQAAKAGYSYVKSYIQN